MRRADDLLARPEAEPIVFVGRDNFHTGSSRVGQIRRGLDLVLYHQTGQVTGSDSGFVPLRGCRKLCRVRAARAISVSKHAAWVRSRQHSKMYLLAVLQEARIVCAESGISPVSLACRRAKDCRDTHSCATAASVAFISVVLFCRCQLRRRYMSASRRRQSSRSARTCPPSEKRRSMPGSAASAAR